MAEKGLPSVAREMELCRFGKMNALMATGHLPVLLLVLGLFFPRLTLFGAWFFSAYPVNNLSDLLNFVLWLFVPRFLIALLHLLRCRPE